jgi:hypothetical protein
LKKNAPRNGRILLQAGRAVFEDSPLLGPAAVEKKRAQEWTRFSPGGEGGRPSQSHPDEPIILLPGTSVQEALLIIDHRQKREFEEPPSG